jgi:hypothetical protein
MTDMKRSETPFILDEVPFAPSWNALAKRLRIKEGSREVAELQAILDEAKTIARPKVLYRLAYIDAKGEDTVVVDANSPPPSGEGPGERGAEPPTLGGITLTSRVLRINLESAHRLFAYVATCGMELQTWGDSLDDMLHRYWVDAIKEMALGAALQALAHHLSTCYDLGRTATMSPGSLADWPLREQRPLFKILGDPEAAIGVQLTDSFLMIPNKTTSGIRFPTEERFESCQLCPREACPGRRAAFEPDLYDRKYA